MENHFHPLFDIDEEEDARRIAIIMPPPIVSLPPVLARHQHTSHFYTIVKRIDRDIGHTGATTLHDLRAIIPRKL